MSVPELSRVLERYFRLLLRHTVENHPTPISVTYITPGEHCKKSEVFHSHASAFSSSPQLNDKQHTATTDPASASVEALPTTTPPSEPLHIVFQTISPTFYSRFAHYQSPHAALASELLDDERTRTAWSSHPDEFAALFEETRIRATSSFTDASPPGSGSAWQWALLPLLRRAPARTNFPRATPCAAFGGLSDMDRFVLSRCSAGEIRTYRRAVLRLFVGEWIGGVWFGPLKRFTDDFEPYGLSRDGALRVWDAVVKTVLLIKAVAALRFEGEGEVVAGGAAGSCWLGYGLWAVSGNLWAICKACI